MALREYGTKAEALANLKRQTTPEQRKNYRVVKKTCYVIQHKPG